jgi:hypothetical protein
LLTEFLEAPSGYVNTNFVPVLVEMLDLFVSIQGIEALILNMDTVDGNVIPNPSSL